MGIRLYYRWAYFLDEFTIVDQYMQISAGRIVNVCLISWI